MTVMPGNYYLNFQHSGMAVTLCTESAKKIYFVHKLCYKIALRIFFLLPKITREKCLWKKFVSKDN